MKTFEMRTLGDDYCVLVIGSSGALGSVFCELLNKVQSCVDVHELERRTAPRMHLQQHESIAITASGLAEVTAYKLILHAASMLNCDRIKTNKSYIPTEDDAFKTALQVNK